jgi:glycosyltransferase involved in cell wall biosynthesis
MAALGAHHQFVYFVDDTAARHIPGDTSGVEAVLVPQSRPPTAAASSDSARSPRDMLRFTAAVARARLDVFFSPSVYTYFPLPLGLPAVITIHDAIAERFPELTVPSRRARLFWNLKLRLALRQATLVLTVSEYARRDVARVHGIPEDRLRVAVEAPAAAYTPVRDRVAVERAATAVGVPSSVPWLVYVGGFNPHKNVDVIVRAHARLAKECGADGLEAPHLVLVGTTTDDVFHGSLDQIRTTIADAGTGDLVHWPGFVPDVALASLLSGAQASLLVSDAEGFGLPAVEAAACACPVVATTESPLPMLLEGGGIFVRPRDEDALLGALRTLAADPAARQRMGEAGLARARALSWESAARSALGALEEAGR